ncbi:MAG: hypothetical protein KDJ66_14960, partial [Nitratireductor sp.]|nr:hypothetical protein [Nitratireductor sp.]
MRQLRIILMLLSVFATFLPGTPLISAAMALEVINVSRDEKAVDITGSVDLYSQQSESLKISTAPDREG